LRATLARDLLRPAAVATFSDVAALQRRDPAPARDAAEDAPQHRRARPPAQSGPRSLEHGEAVPRALDERAGRLARPAALAAPRGPLLGEHAAAIAAPRAPCARRRPPRRAA